MLMVSLQHPTIKAPTLELFAKRADCRRQERFDFGLRLTRPAQRPKQCACRQISSGKAVPDQKWPSLERLVEPVKRQQEAQGLVRKHADRRVERWFCNEEEARDAGWRAPKG